jgi:hypothetical protein
VSAIAKKEASIDPYKPIQTHTDQYRSIQTHTDTCRHIQTHTRMYVHPKTKKEKRKRGTKEGKTPVMSVEDRGFDRPKP